MTWDWGINRGREREVLKETLSGVEMALLLGYVTKMTLCYESDDGLFRRQGYAVRPKGGAIILALAVKYASSSLARVVGLR